MHGIAPKNLGPVVRVADLPGRQSLHSAGTNCLVVPPFKLSTIGVHVYFFSSFFSLACRPNWVDLQIVHQDVGVDGHRTCQRAMTFSAGVNMVTCGSILEANFPPQKCMAKIVTPYLGNGAS